MRLITKRLLLFPKLLIKLPPHASYSLDLASSHFDLLPSMKQNFYQPQVRNYSTRPGMPFKLSRYKNYRQHNHYTTQSRNIFRTYKARFFSSLPNSVFKHERVREMAVGGGGRRNNHPPLSNPSYPESNFESFEMVSRLSKGIETRV